MTEQRKEPMTKRERYILAAWFIFLLAAMAASMLWLFWPREDTFANVLTKPLSAGSR